MQRCVFHRASFLLHFAASLFLYIIVCYKCWPILFIGSRVTYFDKIYLVVNYSYKLFINVFILDNAVYCFGRMFTAIKLLRKTSDSFPNFEIFQKSTIYQSRLYTQPTHIRVGMIVMRGPGTFRQWGQSCLPRGGSAYSEHICRKVD